MSDTEGSGFGALGSKLLSFSPLRAGSALWRSAEDAIQAIYEILLNIEDLTVEVVLDRSKFLPAVGFEGGFQVSDFPFEGVDLELSLGYPGSCPILFCIRRYVGRLTGRVEDKRPHKRRTTIEGCLLSDEHRGVRLNSASVSI